jgi:AraC-like DNA-binding protein
MPDSFDRASASRQSGFLLVDLTRPAGAPLGQTLDGAGPARETPSLLTPPADQALSARHGPGRQGQTHPAIAHVVTHFDRKIALHHVAALCRLSPSQFCRVFKQEQGLSFGQHLMRYRLDRACEGLTNPGALAKEVAYAVGFNDLSYFTRAFKRQTGVCPSRYQAGAR